MCLFIVFVRDLKGGLYKTCRKRVIYVCRFVLNLGWNRAITDRTPGYQDLYPICTRVGIILVDSLNTSIQLTLYSFRVQTDKREIERKHGLL